MNNKYFGIIPIFENRKKTRPKQKEEEEGKKLSSLY